jgi:hypothetical protein
LLCALPLHFTPLLRGGTPVPSPCRGSLGVDATSWESQGVAA